MNDSSPEIFILSQPQYRMVHIDILH